VNDPVDRVLAEREAIDRGFPAALILSLSAHLLLVGGAFAATLIGSRRPLLQVVDGIAVPLPPGGGGSPTLAAPAPAAPEPAPPATAPAKPEPPPRIIKPPKEERRKGLPEPDARRAKKPKAEKSPPPRPASGAPGGTGTSAQTPGFEFGPLGPGVPGGTDPLGDWYLAGVQQKIWLLWNQQIRTGMPQPAFISFTILPDGSLGQVETVQSCGISVLDLAAKRAIYSAAPFGPLPKHYGDKLTIQGVFKPGS
jgi:TonB family protein